jgi:hypothetical protein
LRNIPVWSANPDSQIATFATFAEGPQIEKKISGKSANSLICGTYLRTATFGKILKTVIFPAGQEVEHECVS